MLAGERFHVRSAAVQANLKECACATAEVMSNEGMADGALVYDAGAENDAGKVNRRAAWRGLWSIP